MAFEGIQFFMTTMFNKWFLDILRDKHISGKCNVVPAIFVNFQMQVSPSINPSIHPSIHSSMDPSTPPYMLHICITYAYIYILCFPQLNRSLLWMCLETFLMTTSCHMERMSIGSSHPIRHVAQGA